MSDSKSLRDAAAILLAQADILDGKNPGTYYGEKLGPILEAWNKMIAQFDAEDAHVNDEFEIGKIVTAYKPVIDAAHREGWPSNLGEGRTFWVGNYKTAAKLREALNALSKTTQYAKWASNPLNAHLVPKSEP